MKASKDLKFYDRWTREEAKQFLNMYINMQLNLYLDGYSYRSQHYCCQQIAEKLNRTIPAIKFRVGEVRSILTGGKRGQPISKWTPSMIGALDEVLRDRNLKTREAIKIF